jgi:hypothetical protein
MWDFLKANSNPLGVGALTGSMATYLLTQLVSYLRREKHCLGYSVRNRTIAKSGYPSLVMKYDTRNIVRLDSHTIQFRNIGNRSLVRLPITIETHSGDIVEHESGIPKGAACTRSLNGNGQLVVALDLLKPGEVFFVGLTVVDAEEGRVNVLVRNEFLELKEIDEHADTEELLDILRPRLP